LLRLYLTFSYGYLFILDSDIAQNFPYWIVVLRFIVEFLCFGCLWWASVSVWKNQNNKYIASSILLLEFIFSFTRGRREMFFIFFVIFICGYLVKGKISEKLKIKFSVLCIILVLIIFPIYHQFRVDYSSLKSGNAFERAYNGLFFESINTQNAKEQYRSNLSERPLNIVRSICEILEKEEDASPMYGKAIFSTFENVIPRVFFPDKINQLIPKNSVQNYFNISIYDCAATWLFYGCADWGVLGGLIMGLFFGFILALFERIALKIRTDSLFTSYCILITCLYLAVSVEMEPMNAYTAFRNILIVYIVSKYFKIGLKR
jgi:hypothetical protein